jgi:L-ascorbate metabolism protein UlaG (beta-lactamase superfamily)
MRITITHIDTACVLLDINGYIIMTDPTLDKGGKRYYHGSGSFSRKTGDPAISVDTIPPVDLILLSHHQHKDNFDHEGKKFTMAAPLVLSTKAAAKKVKGVKGLKAWEGFDIDTPKIHGLRITATPAQHHPWWVPGFLAGPVIGFIIEFYDQPDGVIYITGDTVYFRGIDEVAKRYKVDIGIFHVGSVEFRYLTGFGKYTMNGAGLLTAARMICPRKLIPIHTKGWSHFKESEQKLKARIDSDPFISRKTLFLEPGIPTILS